MGRYWCVSVGVDHRVMTVSCFEDLSSVEDRCLSLPPQAQDWQEPGGGDVPPSGMWGRVSHSTWWHCSQQAALSTANKAPCAQDSRKQTDLIPLTWQSKSKTNEYNQAKRLLYFPAGDQSYPLSLLTVGGSGGVETDLRGQEEKKKKKYNFHFQLPPPDPLTQLSCTSLHLICWYCVTKIWVTEFESKVQVLFYL